MGTSGGWRAWTVAALAGFISACGGDGGGSSEGTDAAPDLARGEKVYAAACAMCHGADLRGTSRGPSQLSKVYEPSHHPDAAYRSAVRNGVRAHHWNFGNMPAVPGVTGADLESVIAYIRSEQVKQGFEPYPPPN
jgi:mono/diheme cytochrome c family protein